MMMVGSVRLQPDYLIIGTYGRRALVHDLAVEYGHGYGGLAKRPRARFEDVVRENDDIREHPACERALALLIIRRIRRVARVRVDGVAQIPWCGDDVFDGVSRIERRRRPVAAEQYANLPLAEHVLVDAIAPVARWRWIR